MLRKIFLYFLPCAVGAMIGLLMCEGVLRMFYPQGIVRTAFFVRDDPELGWVNKRGSEGRFQLLNDRPSFVRVNSHGFRGGEFPLEKRRGVKRLCIIGDSNIFGYRLEETETLAHYAAENLRDSYEVLNTGVIGYGTDQELIYLRREVLSFSPDLVIVGFSAGNEIVDVTCSARFGYQKPFFTLNDGRLALHNVPVPESSGMEGALEGKGMGRFLMRHSHLYRFIAYRSWLKPYLNNKNDVAAMSIKEGWQVMEAIVKEMKSLCDGAGSRLLFVIIPDGRLFDSMERMSSMFGDGGSRSRIEEILERNDIAYIDLWSQFLIEHKRGRRLYIEGDPDHLNAEGNRIAADHILARIGGPGL